MKFVVLVFLLAVASCQGAAHVGKSSRALRASLNGLVEQVREIIKSGDEELGVPVLDPFNYEKFEYAIESDSANVDAKFANVVAHGLSEFVAPTVTFSVIGVRFTYCFEWASINVTSDYSIDGTVASIIPIYGAGSVQAEVKDINVCGTVGLSVRNSYLYVRTCDTQIKLGDFNIDMKGLMNDDEISALISAVVTDLVPQIVKDFEPQINGAVNKLITTVGDQYLGTMTLSDLIGLING